MRRPALAVLAWVVATALATGVAWWAVELVGAAVTPSASAPITIGDLPSPAGTSAAPSPSGPVATTRPTPAGTTPAPATAGPRSTTRTVSATGGTLSVRFTGPEVELLWARPNAGFSTRVVRQDPDRVEVEFRSTDHVSRLRARAGAVEVDESD